MQKVYEIIREWYESKKIIQRKEMVSDAFYQFFGIEPTWVGIENRRVTAYRRIKADKLPKHILELIKEIVSTVEDDFEIDCIEVITTETEEKDRDWNEEVGCPDYGYALKRSMVRDGLKYIVSIRYVLTDC